MAALGLTKPIARGKPPIRGTPKRRPEPEDLLEPRVAIGVSVGSLSSLPGNPVHCYVS